MEKMSRMEILLTASIGSSEFLQSKYELAEHYFDIACNNIPNLYYQPRANSLAIVYYSAAKNCKYQKKYEKALKICKLGIDWNIYHQSLYRLSELLFEIGDILRLQQDHKQIESYFINALSVALIIKNMNLIELMIKEYEPYTNEMIQLKSYTEKTIYKLI